VPEIRLPVDYTSFRNCHSFGTRLTTTELTTTGLTATELTTTELTTTELTTTELTTTELTATELTATELTTTELTTTELTATALAFAKLTTTELLWVHGQKVLRCLVRCCCLRCRFHLLLLHGVQVLPLVARPVVQGGLQSALAACSCYRVDHLFHSCTYFALRCRWLSGGFRTSASCLRVRVSSCS
jgi:hypothetical protein